VPGIYREIHLERPIFYTEEPRNIFEFLILLFGCDTRIEGCQQSEIEENAEEFGEGPKRKVLIYKDGENNDKIN